MTRRFLLLTTCAALACGEPPTTPPAGPGPDPDPVVASVAVTSEAGALLAVGGSALLTARAADASGTTVPATLAWASSDPAVATISTTGRITAAAPGSVDITASSGTISGNFAVTVADADLVALRAVLEDPFGEALISGLSTTAGATLDATWTRCEQALSDGHLAVLQECAAEARTTLASDTDAPTRPLRSVLALLVDWIDRFINPTTVS